MNDSEESEEHEEVENRTVALSHIFFEVYLGLFFNNFQVWCLHEYRNSQYFNQDIIFREVNATYDWETQTFTRPLEIEGLNSPHILAMEMSFNFDFVEISRADENLINDAFVHEKIFESLKAQKNGKAKFRFKVVGDSASSIDNADWSEWTFYNIPNALEVPHAVVTTYRRIFQPIATPSFTLINVYERIHLVPPVAQLDMAPQLWQAIGRITDMAEHVINRKLNF